MSACVYNCIFLLGLAYPSDCDISAIFFTRFSTKWNSPYVVRAFLFEIIPVTLILYAEPPLRRHRAQLLFSVKLAVCCVYLTAKNRHGAQLGVFGPIGIRLVPSLCKMVTTVNTGKIAIHYMCSLLGESVNINKYSLGFKHSVVPTNICLHFISFIGGGNMSGGRKPKTCSKSLTNLIT